MAYRLGPAGGIHAVFMAPTANAMAINANTQMMFTTAQTRTAQSGIIGNGWGFTRAYGARMDGRL